MSLAPPYAAAPDGQRFLVLTPVAPGQILPATVTLNWTPQLQP